MCVIRFINEDEICTVERFYQARNYGGGRVDPKDRILATWDGEEIVGVVRISYEHGFACLRGMQVHPGYQRNGLGTKILYYLMPTLDLDRCYCLPYSHLVRFYQQVGFNLTDRKSLPVELGHRLQSYIQRGLNIVPMVRD